MKKSAILLETSHGALRPTVPQIGIRADCGLRDDLPPGGTDHAAPFSDPKTGRFTKGNQAAKRRRAKALAKALPGLDPARCEAWLAPFARLAIAHAGELLAGLPAQTPALSALATNTAAALGVCRALLQLGAAGDRDALAEARQWLREHRQSSITLIALSRESHAQQGGEGQPPPWLIDTDDKPHPPLDEPTAPAPDAVKTSDEFTIPIPRKNKEPR